MDRNDPGRPGGLVVAQLGDGSYVCKLLTVGRSGSYLVSPDPTVSSEPAVIPLPMVERIVGGVVEVRRRVG